MHFTIFSPLLNSSGSFFHIYLFQFSMCFKHPCAHHQENQLY
jgi:hypothetical protein